MGPAGTYGNKWQFTFIADNGTEYLINIRQKNYTGAVTQASLGRAPILKRENNDAICGTSLEIYAESATEGEFSTLYTSDAREFYVELQHKNGSTWDTVWMGFVTPELYSEPDIAPPYDVQIIATDGLGELKSYQFPESGRVSLASHIKTCLDKTGLVTSLTDIELMNGIRSTSPVSINPQDILSVKTNLDYLVGESCYDVLSKILTSLNAKITYDFSGGCWCIVRYNDLDREAWDAAGNSTRLDVESFGSMLTCDYWPIGNLSATVVPAKKRLSTSLPYKVNKSMLTNPDFNNGITGWTRSGTQTMPSFIDIAPSGQRPQLWATGVTVRLKQILSGLTPSANNMSLNVGLLSSVTTGHGNGPGVGLIQIISRSTTTSTNYYLKKSGDKYIWSATENHIELDIPAAPATPTISDFTAYEITLPGVYNTVEVEFYSDRDTDGDLFAVGWAYLTQHTPYGYKDTVSMGNGAREEDKDVEIAFGDAPTPAASLLNVQNILSVGNNDTLTGAYWQHNRITGSHSFLELMAIDRAIIDYSPRVKYTGKLNVGTAVPPMLFGRDSVLYFCETMSWNILDSEMDCELISKSTATGVTVESSTIVEITDAQASSGSSSGSGGGGGGGGTTDFDQLSNRPKYAGVSIDHSTNVPLVKTAEWDAKGTYSKPSGGIPASDLASAVQNKLNVIAFLENHFTEVYGEEGLILREGDVDASIQLYGRKFISLDDHDLGTPTDKWGNVWAASFLTEKITVGGLDYHIGIKAIENVNGFNFIGDVYFQGGGIYPDGRFLGQDVETFLGNGANGKYWTYLFVKNIFFNRADNVNHGLRYISALNRLESDIKFWAPELTISNDTGLAGDDYPTINYKTTLDEEQNPDETLFDFNYGAEFDGNVYADNINVSSDRKLKANISDIKDADASDILSELRPVDFDWRSNGDRGHGFIAQEVEDVVSDLVKEKADGTLSLNYTGIIAYLVKGWQMHEARIADLEEQIEKLKK